VPVSLKYATVERERRFLVSSIPEGVTRSVKILDRYIIGSRLRLREVAEVDGTIVRKLGQKIRISPGPEEVASTTLYLDDAEWDLLCRLPSRVLRKTRHIMDRDGIIVAIDEHNDGTLVAEIDYGDRPPSRAPAWLPVLEDVSHDERWTGAHLAR
jgi:CYTH domain-containing protein